MDRHPLRQMTEVERVAKLAADGKGPDLLPLNLTAQERQAAQMEPEINPGPSPTGTPVVTGTGLFLKIAVGVVAVAYVFSVSNFFPASSLDETIANGVLALGAMLGIASPGVRKAG